MSERITGMIVVRVDGGQALAYDLTAVDIDAGGLAITFHTHDRLDQTVTLDPATAQEFLAAVRPRESD
jgi:hypothetical protein